MAKPLTVHIKQLPFVVNLIAWFYVFRFAFKVTVVLVALALAVTLVALALSPVKPAFVANLEAAVEPFTRPVEWPR